MTHMILAAMTSALLAVLMPAMLLSQPSGQDEADLVLIIEEKVAAEPSVLLSTEDGIQQISIEEYLVGVVLAEMPASFHIEALKAQAVAARTFTMSKLKAQKHSDCTICADSGCCQAWCSIEDMKEKLGDSYSEYIEKVSRAVKETAGEHMTYAGELIEAVFFSCSGGKTEAAVAVWGNDVPYLQSVESAGEEYALKYESEKIITVDAFKNILQENDRDLQFSDSPQSWIRNIRYTDGNGVDSLEICGRQISGTELRALFGLNSTSFEIEIDKEFAVFHVKGYGHRVGMSQYGANAMANEGADYEKILRHYYQGIEIDK